MQGDVVAPQRRGLGKGLGALIPEATPSPSATSPIGPPGAPSRAAGAFGGVPGESPAAIPPAPASETGLQEVAGAYFAEIGVGAIAPNQRQPRTTFDEDALDELAASIA